MAAIIDMPKLSDTMTVGTVVNWIVKEGDAVKAGDMICEIETDKATMELENFEDGIVLKILVPEGGQAAVGAPMVIVGEKGEALPDLPEPAAAPVKEAPKKAAPAPEKKVETAPAPEKSKAPKPSLPKAPVASSSSSDSRISASPLARKIAKTNGIPLERVKGTGPNGRITKDDILSAIDSGIPLLPSNASGSAEAPSMALSKLTQEEIPVTTMRGVIARRLLESKTEVPHFYLEMEVDAEPLAKARASINKQFESLAPEQGGFKLTVNDFILKAVANSLARNPDVNAAWGGDVIQKYGTVNLAFGVAIDDGLVTPVIRNAETKDLKTISQEAKELIKKSRSKKLTPAEMSGSTFTVTNLGMFGISSFYGIINMPNAAILSVGATVKKPVVDENNNIVVGYRMNIGLSCDHRVVDGAVGAQFLQTLASQLENPTLLMI
jgi:pyruvate dehydrogenase E2 component (dihydrolipoamide acetyltransferase)